jgi:hypothetical protein
MQLSLAFGDYGCRTGVTPSNRKVHFGSALFDIWVMSSRRNAALRLGERNSELACLSKDDRIMKTLAKSVTIEPVRPVEKPRTKEQ